MTIVFTYFYNMTFAPQIIPGCILKSIADPQVDIAP